MNIVTKLWRDITRQYVYKARKEKRYKALLQCREYKTGAIFHIYVTLRDLPENNDFYQVVETTDNDRVDGLDIPLRKNAKIIQVISAYEIEIKEKFYY